eukprot:1153720-Pelagomonas_calceolata.AAC.1
MGWQAEKPDNPKGLPRGPHGKSLPWVSVTGKKAAFNTTDHDRMLWIMYDLGFPTDAIDTVKNLYESATTKVRLPSGRSTEKNPVER